MGALVVLFVWLLGLASALTERERSLRARLAVETSWSRTADPRARTQAARQAFDERFERQVDPEGVLPEAERQRRATHARRAYFAALALKSAQARRRRAGG